MSIFIVDILLVADGYGSRGVVCYLLLGVQNKDQDQAT